MCNHFLFKASFGARKKLISWPKILLEFHIHMPELFEFEIACSRTYVLLALLTFSSRSKRHLFTVQFLGDPVVPSSCSIVFHLQFKVTLFLTSKTHATQLQIGSHPIDSCVSSFPSSCRWKTFPVPAYKEFNIFSSWHFASCFSCQLRPACGDYFSRMVPCAVFRFLLLTSRCCIEVTTR